MNLNNKQKQHLKSLAHPLKPVVMIGNNGLTKAVLAEIEQTLEHHEIIKIKITPEKREAKSNIADTIVDKTHATIVQIIGNILVFYRPAKDRKIVLPRS